MINIKGLDKAAVLAALVNGTESQGWGVLHDRGTFTRDDAEKFISSGTDDVGFSRGWRMKSELDFDYVAGRPIKADISGDEFDEQGYDYGSYPGAAAEAIAKLRSTSS